MNVVHSAGIITFRLHKGVPEYLILHYESGHWDFPKGKIEQGETYEQAAHRELLEETGTTAEIIPGFLYEFDYMFREYSGTRPLTKKQVHFFVGRAITDTVTLSYEHQDYQWLSYDDAMRRLTYGNAKKMLIAAHQFVQQWLQE